MNQKLLAKYITDARNGDTDIQQFLENQNIDWDNGEPINNAMTETQADFLSPKQFARPKEKRLNGWQKTHNAMNLRAKDRKPDFIYEGK